MSDASHSPSTFTVVKNHLPELPLVVWMVLLTVVLGLIGGLEADELAHQYNVGFGRALGEFALILLPSFTIAAALSVRNISSETAGRTAALTSPLAGSAMICPDTAYAALSPAAGRYKLATAFGSYAGFKLLYPAGPLIVATGLGLSGTTSVEPVALLLCGVFLTLPTWAAGVLWGRTVFGTQAQPIVPETEPVEGRLLLTFAPFVVIAGLLFLGAGIGGTESGAIDFFLTPKGALILAATLALLQTSVEQRRACLESAVNRTGSLLLVIGAASAFGSVLTDLVPLEAIMPRDTAALTLLALFVLSAAFKVIQGSSMATFAAVAPVAAHIVLASDVSEIAAVFAICLGSFVTILPNDSYYWLVRRDLLQGDTSEGPALLALSCGAFLQALVGLAALLTIVALGVI
ncbi:MAG: hypothetical protein AAGB10_14410 [Pseudomonadota bacterium]